MCIREHCHFSVASFCFQQLSSFHMKHRKWVRNMVEVRSVVFVQVVHEVSTFPVLHQKVSLKWLARAFPRGFHHHIWIIQCKMDLRIKDALVLEILFPVRVVTPDFAKKFDMSSNLWFPLTYRSKAKRTMRDFFFSTTIVFVRESLRYPKGAWLGNMPILTFWRSPRFVFSEREST